MNLKTLKEKFDSVNGAFAINNKLVDLVKGKTIFLIDDIVTTVASVNECAKMLKTAGAKKVYVFSLGRTIMTTTKGKA